MKKLLIILFLTFGILNLTACLPKQDSNLKINNIAMKLTSLAFNDNSPIPAEYTCDGSNINPPLHISAVPSQAQSLVLIVDDPDAPAGTWVHWLVWNIDPQTTDIVANSVPTNAVFGQTSFKRQVYGGPCPPSGQHRYFFKLYALSSQLDLPAGSTIKDLEQAMQNKIIDSSQLIGLYSRQ